MSTLAVFSALCAVALYACATYHNDRATNLEFANAKLLDDCLELRATLDDAVRLVEKLQTSNSELICEATTLCDDLARLEKERAWLASGYSYNKAVQASSMLYVAAWQGMNLQREKLP